MRAGILFLGAIALHFLPLANAAEEAPVEQRAQSERERRTFDWEAPNQFANTLQTLKKIKNLNIGEDLEEISGPRVPELPQLDTKESLVIQEELRNRQGASRKVITVPLEKRVSQVAEPEPVAPAVVPVEAGNISASDSAPAKQREATKNPLKRFFGMDRADVRKPAAPAAPVEFKSGPEIDQVSTDVAPEAEKKTSNSFLRYLEKNFAGEDSAPAEAAKAAEAPREVKVEKAGGDTAVPAVKIESLTYSEENSAVEGRKHSTGSEKPPKAGHRPVDKTERPSRRDAVSDSAGGAGVSAPIESLKIGPN